MGAQEDVDMASQAIDTKIGREGQENNAELDDLEAVLNFESQEFGKLVTEVNNRVASRSQNYVR